MDLRDRFRGVKVDIEKHWDGAYHVTDNQSGKILAIGTLEQCLEIYDRLNDEAIYEIKEK